MGIGPNDASQGRPHALALRRTAWAALRPVVANSSGVANTKVLTTTASRASPKPSPGPGGLRPVPPAVRTACHELLNGHCNITMCSCRVQQCSAKWAVRGTNKHQHGTPQAVHASSRSPAAGLSAVLSAVRKQRMWFPNGGGEEVGSSRCTAGLHLRRETNSQLACRPAGDAWALQHGAPARSASSSL